MVSREDAHVASVDMFPFEPAVVALLCYFVQLALLQTQLVPLTCLVLEHSSVQTHSRAGPAGGRGVNQSPGTELPLLRLLAHFQFIPVGQRREWRPRQAWRGSYWRPGRRNCRAGERLYQSLVGVGAGQHVHVVLRACFAAQLQRLQGLGKIRVGLLDLRIIWSGVY